MLAVAAPVQVGVTVEERAVDSVAVNVLRSTPEVGVAADNAVVAAVDASGKSTEACGIVLGRYVSHSTSIRSTTIPACCRGQGLSYISVNAATYILALAAHIVGQLCPLRVARHMPARGTYTLNTTGVCTAGG